MKTKLSSIILFTSVIGLFMVILIIACNKNNDQSGNLQLKTLNVKLSGNANCPNMAQLYITYSAGFGQAKVVELYQAVQCGSYSKIASFNYNVTTYSVKSLVSGLYYAFYVRVQRSSDNLWYTSPTINVFAICGSGSGSGSLSGSGSSSGSGSLSGGPGPCK